MTETKLELTHPVAKLRKVIGYTQAEIAKLAGCSVPTVKAIEGRKLKLSKRLALRISLETGVSASSLLSEEQGSLLLESGGKNSLFSKEIFERWRNKTTEKHGEVEILKMLCAANIFVAACLKSARRNGNLHTTGLKLMDLLFELGLAVGMRGEELAITPQLLDSLFEQFCATNIPQQLLGVEVSKLKATEPKGSPTRLRPRGNGRAR